MLSLRILNNKYSVNKPHSSIDGDNDTFPDITRSSINIEKFRKLPHTKTYMVTEEDKMRPDLIANAVYSDQSALDLLLKYNAISNPFSVYPGKLLFIPEFSDIINCIKRPIKINDISNITIDDTEKIFLDPKTDKDKKRLDLLKKQSKGKEILPSNVNKKGDKNVKIKDGKIVFGEDVTSVNRKDCPEPISRANLKKALIQNNLFG